MKKSLLQINLKIEIASEGDKENYYVSSVQDITDDTVAVSRPLRRSKVLALLPGEPVLVRFAIKDAVYSFRANVLERTISNRVPLYVLTRPTAFQRSQRRSFVRLPISLPVQLSVLSSVSEEASDETLKGTVMDLSGGGVQIVTSKQIAVGEKLLLEILLDQKNLPAMRLQGQVAWVEEGGMGKALRLGVSFTEIDERHREQIIAYIFRQMRGKALS